MTDSADDEFVPMEKSANEETPSDIDVPANEDTSVGASDGGTAEPELPDPSLMAPPPASFEVLISMLFTQAMGTLGQMPNPATGKAEVNKPFAKHYIDTLEMLGEKTDGNLNDDEAKMLGEALHALRMAYVSTKA